MDEAPSTGKITLANTGDFWPEEEESSSPSLRRFGLLVFCEGDAQLQVLADGRSVIVGRHAPSEIVVDDSSVSRQHARFSRRGDEVWVEDLDSRNGTFCRSQRIQKQLLDVAAEVRIGKARVVLAATRQPEARPAEEVSEDGAFVLRNPRMKQLYEEVARAAPTELPVLVLGETGVGKEHVARAIHRESARKDGPFVVVNCAAIATPLLESTLFGHERGAFTGAVARGIGVFERAHGGSLFLDEIGDLALNAQSALLRAIETLRISRLGSSLEIPVDVRIVAATHCDLECMIADRTFRQDLFYRLSGVTLKVPPLRERCDEIEALATLFLAGANRQWGASVHAFTPEAMDVLRSANWPGNVRQLRHAVERAALLARGERIHASDWSESVEGRPAQPAAVRPSAPPIADLALRQQLRRYERTLIEEALRQAGGSRQYAAKLLRIPLRTLFRRIRTSGILVEDDRGSEA
jgi:DNA-binding NtrC family response regulator